jgi:hypothetical protein
MNELLIAIIIALKIHERVCYTNLQVETLSLAFVSHKKAVRKSERLEKF